MKQYIAKSNVNSRRTMLDNIYENNPKKNIGIIFSTLLIVLSIAFLICSVIYSIMKNAGIEGLVLIGAVLIFSSIPFFIGISLKNTFKYKCTLPYCERVNESILINNDGFSYSYLKVKKNNSAIFYPIEYDESDFSDDDMEHFTVCYNKIIRYDINDNILSVYGDFVHKSPNKNKRGFNEFQCNNFSILLDFEDNDLIINLIKDGIKKCE